MSDSLTETTSIAIEAVGSKWKLKSTGTVTKFAGWKAVYKTNSEDNELPVLKQEDKLNLKKLESIQHFTTPPAPSGNNAQPWRFFVVDNQEQKDLLQKNDIFYQDFVYTAPVIIVCCGDPAAFAKNKEFDDKNKDRALRDLSIATSFMTLRATELGLGTCYIGWVDKLKIKELLGIDTNFVLPYVLTVGYADEEPEPRNRWELKDIKLQK